MDTMVKYEERLITFEEANLDWTLLWPYDKPAHKDVAGSGFRHNIRGYGQQTKSRTWEN